MNISLPHGSFGGGKRSMSLADCGRALVRRIWVYLLVRTSLGRRADLRFVRLGCPVFSYLLFGYSPIQPQATEG